jgi:predicted nucleic acid-binding protein
MIALFADTLFYVALLNRRDALHEAAVRAVAMARERIVTTEYVLLEVANFFKRPDDRRQFAAFVHALHSDPNTELVPSNSIWFQRGLDLFNSRPDKEWSLTDCISFAVMTDQSIGQALTADQHFSQAGFVALLH